MCCEGFIKSEEKNMKMLKQENVVCWGGESSCYKNFKL